MTHDIKQIRLNDGRILSYSEYGNDSGFPVLFFHGFPGSHNEGLLFKTAFSQTKARLICIDRPGINLSSYYQKRKLIDWPQDIIQLADQLNLPKFSVLGASGGGPYSLACAYAIPERVNQVGILGGCAPFSMKKATKGMKIENILPFKYGIHFPPILHLIFSNMSKNESKTIVSELLKTMPSVDRNICMDIDIQNMFITDLREAFLQGSIGIVKEVQILGNNWGFNITDIKKHVHIWQGALDINVPPRMGEYFSKIIPSNSFHFLENEGHLSLIYNNSFDILSTMAN